VKLTGAGAAAFCTRPDPGKTGALLWGPDAGLVAMRRRELVAALTEGDDLRLTRLEPAAAARDAAGIDAALRAQGFFPGRRAVLIEGAKDPLAGVLREVLAGIGPQDAFLIVTSEALPARSALRRLFEERAALVALGLYPEPLGRAELAALLDRAGIGTTLSGGTLSGGTLSGGLTPEAAEALAAAAQAIDPGALGQLIEKIAVFALDRDTPVDLATLTGLLPVAADSELDRLVAAVAEGRAEAVGPLLRRLTGAGVGATAMLIAAGRHFRQLLGLAVARDGIDAALGRLRPPAFGPRRRALAAQARRWGPARLETANRLLFQTDRALRSPGDRPDRALVERCLIRLAMMVGRA